MEIIEVKVRMGRTISNPFREFSNLRMDVEHSVRVEKLVDPPSDELVQILQATAIRDLDRAEAMLIQAERGASGRPLCTTCGHTQGEHVYTVQDDMERCDVRGCRCADFQLAEKGKGGPR